MKSRDNLAISDLDIQYKHLCDIFFYYIAAGRRFSQGMLPLSITTTVTI
jgi:hypothetical protein